MSGNAEVFGTELARNKVYTINTRLKIAVFTWYGCTLAISFNYLQVTVAINGSRRVNEWCILQTPKNNIVLLCKGYFRLELLVHCLFVHVWILVM